MIEGFEDITYELTREELSEVPNFVARLSLKVGSHCAVTSAHISSAYQKRGKKMTGPRIRKIINHIRMNGLINRLVASSRGYYVENDPVKYSKYIKSLEQRSYAIYSLIKKMKEQ